MSKGTLVVIMGYHNSNIYVLKGNKVSSAVVVSSLSSSDSDITHL